MDDWLREHMWEAWLGLAILLGVAEMFSLDLILLMLAVGAMAGMVTAAFDADLVIQVLVASAASVGALALVRPNLVKRFETGPDLRLGHGKIWTAAPYDEDLVIEPGETVEVFQIRGATAYVHPIPRLDS